MDPNLKDWVELLSRYPTLPLIAAWGVIEVRRFLGRLQRHLEVEEAILLEIRDGLFKPRRGGSEASDERERTPWRKEADR